MDNPTPDLSQHYRVHISSMPFHCLLVQDGHDGRGFDRLAHGRESCGLNRHHMLRWTCCVLH